MTPSGVFPRLLSSDAGAELRNRRTRLPPRTPRRTRALRTFRAAGEGQPVGGPQQRITSAIDVEAGKVNYPRCGNRILPGDAWDLGNDDRDRRCYGGPEHVACNRGRQPLRLRIYRGGTWKRMRPPEAIRTPNLLIRRHGRMA
jgi:hypothetical protein